jgi:hypothetical protein
MSVHEDPSQTMTTLGRPGETCEECGGPLAVDQRYCLNCGLRRGGARVDYRGVMAATGGSPSQGQVPPPPAPAAGVPPGEEEPPKKERKGERDLAPLAAVGGIAVLGLMLLVGVLIGRGDSSPTAIGAPQVVRVPAAAGTEATGATGGEAKARGGEAGGKGKANANGGPGGKPEATSKGLGGGGGEGDDSVHEVSSGELEELESESGEAAAEKSLDLPNKIATPGAPPPIDKSKPPGGGEGGGLVIK